MATIVVSILCIAIVVFGGVMLSQGILASADTAAISVETISLRENDIARTSTEVLRAAELTWSDTLRFTVCNTGQTRLAGFDRWDIIVNYYDAGSTYHATWLDYTDAATPGANEWTVDNIGLYGPQEYYEPDILNPEEELVILAVVDPLPGGATTAEVSVITPNGSSDIMVFPVPGYTLLVPHAESSRLNQQWYYQMPEAAPADGQATTMTTATFGRHDTGRWLLYNSADTARDARHVFSLRGVSSIPAGTWTVYYRGYAAGNWLGFAAASLNVDIIIRQEDGSVRQVLASNVADAELTSFHTWMTVSGTYAFPGYTVVDETDYLEIVYYATSSGVGSQEYDNYIQLMIDDSTIALSDQTRLES